MEIVPVKQAQRGEEGQHRQTEVPPALPTRLSLRRTDAPSSERARLHQLHHRSPTKLGGACGSVWGPRICLTLNFWLFKNKWQAVLQTI